MVRGVMLIRAAADASTKIVQGARKLREVVEAYPVFGRFDAVVFIVGQNFHELKRAAAKVAALKGVKSTETLAEGD